MITSNVYTLQINYKLVFQPCNTRLPIGMLMSRDQYILNLEKQVWRTLGCVCNRIVRPNFMVLDRDKVLVSI